MKHYSNEKDHYSEESHELLRYVYACELREPSFIEYTNYRIPERVPGNTKVEPRLLSRVELSSPTFYERITLS